MSFISIDTLDRLGIEFGEKDKIKVTNKPRI